MTGGYGLDGDLDKSHHAPFKSRRSQWPDPASVTIEDAAREAQAVAKVFHCFDPHATGLISRDDMRKGLEYLGVSRHHHAADIDSFVKRFDSTSTGMVDYRKAVQYLRVSGDASPVVQVALQAGKQQRSTAFAPEPAGGREVNYADELVVAGVPGARPHDKLTGVLPHPAPERALGFSTLTTASDRPYGTGDDTPAMSSELSEHLGDIEETERRQSTEFQAQQKILEKCAAGKTQKLFRSLDRLGRGRLSPETFATGLQLLGLHPHTDDFNAIKKLAPSTADGEVDYEQFRHRLVTARIAQPDADHSHSAEARAENLAPLFDLGTRLNARLDGRGERLAALLAKYDNAKTGVVRHSELRTALAKDLEISLSDSDARLLQQHFDSNGSGVLRYGYLSNFLRANQGSAHPRKVEVDHGRAERRRAPSVTVKSLAELGGSPPRQGPRQYAGAWDGHSVITWDTAPTAAEGEAQSFGHIVLTPGGMARIDRPKKRVDSGLRDGGVADSLTWSEDLHAPVPGSTSGCDTASATSAATHLSRSLASPGVSGVLAMETGAGKDRQRGDPPSKFKVVHLKERSPRPPSVRVSTGRPRERLEQPTVPDLPGPVKGNTAHRRGDLATALAEASGAIPPGLHPVARTTAAGKPVLRRPLSLAHPG